MDVIKIGKRICEQRKKLGFTQNYVAEQLNVSVQAVSKWENGHNLPDIENLAELAKVLKLPYISLVGEDDTVLMNYRDRLFDEDNMYTRIKTVAQTQKLENTLAALDFMRIKHSGQFRKSSRYATDNVKYINHPLTMACHAHAMGIKDDGIIAAILLHDVVEDTDTSVEDLPVTDEIKEIVSLLTFKIQSGKTKEQSKSSYYKEISANKKACIVKIIDRCNNVSTMAGCFSKEKLIEYIDETEKYIIPLISVIKNTFPEYSDAAFIVKYQIISLIESIKFLV